MPLTSKDKKIMANMTSEYGPEKAKNVFYGSAQKGILGEDVKKRHGAAAHKKKKTVAGADTTKHSFFGRGKY